MAALPGALIEALKRRGRCSRTRDAPSDHKNFPLSRVRERGMFGQLCVSRAALPLKRATRLYVAADLAAGLAVALAPAQAHQLRNVLRLAPGAAVSLFNGRDGEFLACIAE